MQVCVIEWPESYRIQAIRNVCVTAIISRLDLAPIVTMAI